MTPYETIQMDHGIVIKIYQDDDADNPIQEYDNEAHVSIWHRRYSFGNNTKFKTPKAFEEYCDEQDNPEGDEEADPVYRLPVYLYDHSGLTVNTGGFSCPWDSGQVGWVWFTKSEARDKWGVTDEALIYDNLSSTVSLLNDYLTGQVYGYVVEQHDPKDLEDEDSYDLDEERGKALDSCWGFFGDPDENVIPEAKSAAEYYVKKAAENAAVVESLAARAVERYRAEQSRWPAI